MSFTAHRLPDLVLGNGDVVFFNNGIAFYKYSKTGAHISEEDPRFKDDERYLDKVVIRNNHGAELMILTKAQKPLSIEWITWIISEMEDADYAYTLLDVEYQSLHRKYNRIQKTQLAMDLILKPTIGLE